MSYTIKTSQFILSCNSTSLSFLKMDVKRWSLGWHKFNRKNCINIFRATNFMFGGGPSSLPSSGSVFKSSQSMIEDELMLFRLIDLQQQTPTSSSSTAPTSTGNGSLSTVTGISPSPSAANFTAVFREPLTASSILNFGWEWSMSDCKYHAAILLSLYSSKLGSIKQVFNFSTHCESVSKPIYLQSIFTGGGKIFVSILCFSTFLHSVRGAMV